MSRSSARAVMLWHDREENLAWRKNTQVAQCLVTVAQYRARSRSNYHVARATCGSSLPIRYRSLCKNAICRRSNVDTEVVCSALKHEITLVRYISRCRAVALLSLWLNPKEYLHRLLHRRGGCVTTLHVVLDGRAVGYAPLAPVFLGYPVPVDWNSLRVSAL